MLLDQCNSPVNPPSHCGTLGDNLGKAPVKNPTHLVLHWRGGGVTTQEFIGHDVTMAYVLAEGMWGLRDGNAIVLYAMHWSSCIWGRA